MRTLLLVLSLLLAVTAINGLAVSPRWAAVTAINGLAVSPRWAARRQPAAAAAARMALDGNQTSGGQLDPEARASEARAAYQKAPWFSDKKALAKIDYESFVKQVRRREVVCGSNDNACLLTALCL